MKSRRIILLAFGLLACLLLLSACKSQSSERPYDHLVTFDYNYGNLDANCVQQYLGVKDGALVGIEPGYSDDFKLQEVTHYYIEGWYTPKLDTAGNPQVDPETGRVLLDRKWDFEKDTVTSDTVLYANLRHQLTLTYVDRATGEVIGSIAGKSGETRNKPQSALEPKKEGYTFLGYYAEATGTEAFTWPYTFREDVENVNVYVDFIEGSWMVVDSAVAFNKGISANANLYLIADIDFSGSTPWITRSFGGTINGNGHKVTGIKLEQEGSKIFPSGFGLFSVLRAGAHLYDLTFEDVKIHFSAKSNMTFLVAPFATEAEKGARLESVTVTGQLVYDILKSPTSEVYDLIAKNGMRAEDVTDCDFRIVLTNENE